MAQSLCFVQVRDAAREDFRALTLRIVEEVADGDGGKPERTPASTIPRRHSATASLAMGARRESPKMRRRI
jgi:hypothetical protein